jgi:hypothetical protein
MYVDTTYDFFLLYFYHLYEIVIILVPSLSSLLSALLPNLGGKGRFS